MTVSVPLMCWLRRTARSLAVMPCCHRRGYLTSVVDGEDRARDGDPYDSGNVSLVDGDDGDSDSGIFAEEVAALTEIDTHAGIMDATVGAEEDDAPVETETTGEVTTMDDNLGDIDSMTEEEFVAHLKRRLAAKTGEDLDTMSDERAEELLMQRIADQISPAGSEPSASSDEQLPSLTAEEFMQLVGDGSGPDSGDVAAAATFPQIGSDVVLPNRR